MLVSRTLIFKDLLVLLYERDYVSEVLCVHGVTWLKKTSAGIFNMHIIPCIILLKFVI